MFCKNCGHEISDDSKFCSNCGIKVEVDEDIVVPVAVVDKTEEESEVDTNNEEVNESVNKKEETLDTTSEESVNENESTTSVKEWYYVSNNDSKGSFSIDEMKAKITSGEINGSTLVWKASMKDWERLENTELKEFISTSSSNDWYYVENNDSKGAFTLEEMKELIESNKITGSTLVWKASLKDWQKLEDSELNQFMRVDEEKNWYYVENNDSKGPYSQDEMKGFMESGILSGNCFVWKTGMQDWTRLKDTELAGNEMPEQEPTPQPSYYGVKEKSIALNVVLSFVTCGLYGLYWLYTIAKDLNDLCVSQHQEKGPDPFLVVVLSIVTCGIYQIYYMYKAGKMVSSLTKNGQHLSDDSVILMVLAILQLSLVSYCILQSNINGLTKN